MVFQLHRFMLLLSLSAAVACNGTKQLETTHVAETVVEEGPNENESSSIELGPNLCDDPSLMAEIQQAMGTVTGSPSYGDINLAQAQRMMASPTDGPFYMVNLIGF